MRQSPFTPPGDAMARKAKGDEMGEDVGEISEQFEMLLCMQEQAKRYREERDEARAALQRQVKLYQDAEKNWHRRQDNWRESSDRCLKAAEAEVVRLLAEVERLRRNIKAWADGEGDPLQRAEMRECARLQAPGAPNGG